MVGSTDSFDPIGDRIPKSGEHRDGEGRDSLRASDTFEAEALLVPTSSVRAAEARWAGEVEAVAVAAYDAHATQLKAFAMAATRDDDADDLVQETFYRLVRELRTGHQPENVRAWLFRVCGNLIASHGRRRGVRARATFRLAERSTAPSAEEHVIRGAENALLKSALARMRPAERVALLLSASGLDSAEVGRAIGRTPNATRAFLCRSRIELRKQLSALSHES